jgi:hypothetical protein
LRVLGQVMQLQCSDHFFPYFCHDMPSLRLNVMRRHFMGLLVVVGADSEK